jgi:hypothetical protein
MLVMRKYDLCPNLFAVGVRREAKGIVWAFAKHEVLRTLLLRQ